MTRLRLFWVFALQALAGLCAVELAARAGGGDSFSGGGGSGGFRNTMVVSWRISFSVSAAPEVAFTAP